MRRRLHRRDHVAARRIRGVLAIGLLLGIAVVGVRAALVGSPSASSTDPHETAMATTSPGRPPKLVQAADSKSACIYAGIGSGLVQVERVTRVTFNCIETFSDADPTWADWVTPWLTEPGYGYRGWLTAAPQTRTIILTQNLIPDSVASDPNWRAKGAAGDFNKYAQLLAKHLVASGFGYSVIRLGHEMNGTWYNDNVGDDRTQWRQWAAFYAQTVKTMREVPGAHFLFDWNVNAGVRAIPFGDYYPGNAYVDIIGIDFYDVSPSADAPPGSSPRRWSVLSSEPYGLNGVAAFANHHGKPLSIPEWGTVNTTSDVGAGFNASGGGDDGAYVAHVGDFIATHNVAYQSWFDAGDNGVNELSTSAAPKSVAAYVRTISGHQES